MAPSTSKTLIQCYLSLSSNLFIFEEMHILTLVATNLFIGCVTLYFKSAICNKFKILEIMSCPHNLACV